MGTPLRRTPTVRNMHQGRYYDVPHLRAIWNFQGPKWWPVLGTTHDDTQILKFERPHRHVDFRFLRKTDRGMLYSPGTPIHPAFIIPIIMVAPDLPWYRDPYSPLDQIPLSKLPLADLPVTTYFRTMRRRFNQPWPRHPGQIFPWMSDLEQAYNQARLSETGFCPHQGTDLSGYTPDQAGIIECPLHGLRWDAATGALQPRDPSTPEERKPLAYRQ